MKRLVECGLNIDVPEGRFEQSATHLAAFAGHVNVLQWLLENGAFSQKGVSINNLMIFLDYSQLSLRRTPLGSAQAVHLKADLDGTILSHATCLRQAYDTNCVV